MTEEEYLRREKLIVQSVATKLGVKNIEYTPHTHRVDGLFMCDDNRSIHHLIEAKSRNINSAMYETTKLEIGKWMKLKQFNEEIPTILAIGWKDQIGFAAVNLLVPERYSLMNRRYIRRPSDWQIAVEIPIDQFEFIPYNITTPAPESTKKKPAPKI